MNSRDFCDPGRGGISTPSEEIRLARDVTRLRAPKKTGFNSKFRSLNIEVGGKKSSASRGNTSFGRYCPDLRIGVCAKAVFSSLFRRGSADAGENWDIKETSYKVNTNNPSAWPHYWVSREQRLNMSKLLIIPGNSGDDSAYLVDGSYNESKAFPEFRAYHKIFDVELKIKIIFVLY